MARSLSYELNPAYGTAMFIDMMELRDSSVLLRQRVFECGAATNGLVRYAPDWGVIFSLEELIQENLDGAFSDNSFVTHQFDWMEKRTEYGGLVWRLRFDGFDFGPAISGIVVTAEDSLVVATQDGLFSVDKDGGVAASYPEYFLWDIKAMGQGLLVGRKFERFGSHPDSAYLLSPSFSLLGKIGFPGEEIIDIAAEGNRLAVLTSASRVYLYGETLALQAAFQVATGAGRQANFLAIAPDGIVLAGTERYGSQQAGKGNNAAFLKKYNFDGSTADSGRDAGVVFIDMGQEPYGYPSGAGYYKLLFRDVKIRVQNFGDSLLRQVNVNIEFPMVDTLCVDGFQQFSRQYEGLSILPGETAELSWDELWATFDEDPTGDLEFCMWTSMPDLKLDKDSSNDLYCIHLTVTGLDDGEPLNEFSLQVFPNPSSAAHSTIRYQLPAGAPGEIRVFNPVGNLVARHAVAGEKGTLELAKQPAGLYYVVLAVGGKPARVLKFIQL